MTLSILELSLSCTFIFKSTCFFQYTFENQYPFIIIKLNFQRCSTTTPWSSPSKVDVKCQCVIHLVLVVEQALLDSQDLFVFLALFVQVIRIIYYLRLALLDPLL